VHDRIEKVRYSEEDIELRVSGERACNRATKLDCDSIPLDKREDSRYTCPNRLRKRLRHRSRKR